MTNNEIVEGNKLIVIFMFPNFQKEFDENEISIKEGMFAKACLFARDWEALKYHISWEWLMHVINKIESIKDSYHGYFGVHIVSNSCSIQATKFRSDQISDPPYYFTNVVGSTKIEAVWISVVNFIKWYNKQ